MNQSFFDEDDFNQLASPDSLPSVVNVRIPYSAQKLSLNHAIMSTHTRVLALTVSAKRISDLAFNVGGIVESMNSSSATLGASVRAYDLRAALYTHLAEPELSSGKPTGRLVYDSAKIRSILLPHALAVLSNEVIAAELDQAISRRQNQFLSRNQFIEQIEKLVQDVYPKKVGILTNLLALSEQHFQALHSVYNPTGSPANGVTSPKVVMATRITGIGSKQVGATSIKEGGVEKQSHNYSTQSSMTKWDPAAANPSNPAQPGAWIEITDPDAIALSQETVSVSENDELRHPNLENQIRYNRTAVDLIDEILSESIFNLKVPNLGQLMNNELADSDLEIRKLQIQYVETFLTPRLDGLVTAVMKEAGDNVRAGESVVRIEDDSIVLLGGSVKHIGAVVVGRSCTITTDNLFESVPPVQRTLEGTVVAVRGYDTESDRWNVIIECDNSQIPKLPLGYVFESHPDSTRLHFNI